MENINEALSLLAVGMIMVFIILTLVVVIGNTVVYLTNRYVPVTQKPADGGGTLNHTNRKKMAAIAAVVDLITRGEGRVDSIQKK
ncbi:MAG: oxaloacetate decarboxylase [Clostridia bacterium]|nr:oxaloacetate decarboxylase [Clostridia bacterium]